MNLQVEVNGFGKVDFSLRSFGWVRNPKLELCGVDDADLCKEQLSAFLGGLCPVPFENVQENEAYLDKATDNLVEAMEQYLRTGQEVNLVDVIHVHIRPVPKSSRESTPEEIADLIGRMGGA